MRTSWLLHFQGSSVCQVTAVGVTVILLYTSRACYNLFILSFPQSRNVHPFDYDWYNVSDQVSGRRAARTASLCSAASRVAETHGPLAVALPQLDDREGHFAVVPASSSVQWDRSTCCAGSCVS